MLWISTTILSLFSVRLGVIFQFKLNETRGRRDILNQWLIVTDKYHLYRFRPQTPLISDINICASERNCLFEEGWFLTSWMIAWRTSSRGQPPPAKDNKRRQTSVNDQRRMVPLSSTRHNDTKWSDKGAFHRPSEVAKARSKVNGYMFLRSVSGASTAGRLSTVCMCTGLKMIRSCQMFYR